MLAAALMVGAAGNLPPPERSYKILMLLPASSKSHKNVFMALAEALADRGHKVSLILHKIKCNNSEKTLDVHYSE